MQLPELFKGDVKESPVDDAQLSKSEKEKEGLKSDVRRDWSIVLSEMERKHLEFEDSLPWLALEYGEDSEKKQVLCNVLPIHIEDDANNFRTFKYEYVLETELIGKEVKKLTDKEWSVVMTTLTQVAYGDQVNEKKATFSDRTALKNKNRMKNSKEEDKERVY